MTNATKRLSLIFLGLFVFQAVFSIANADKDLDEGPPEKPKESNKDKDKGKGKDNRVNAVQLISNIPDHVMDFVTIVINAFVNPDTWHGELCGKTKTRALPAQPKEKKKIQFKLTSEQLEGLIEYLKSASKSMYFVLRLASEILAHPTNWKDEFCKSNPP